MSEADPKNVGAVLQMEIDVKRWKGIAEGDFEKQMNEVPMQRLKYIVRTAANDVIRNGGTLVLVADDKTITIVQRPKGAIE